jgi:hypothetical protein
MKRLILALPLVVALFAACSASTPAGPEESERLLTSAGEPCNPNIRPC